MCVFCAMVVTTTHSYQSNENRTETHIELKFQPFFNIPIFFNVASMLCISIYAKQYCF